jgi:hypothetical protein
MTEVKRSPDLAFLKQLALDRTNHPIARKVALSTLASYDQPGRDAINEFIGKTEDPKLREFARKTMDKFKEKSDGKTWEKESRA